MIAIYEVLIDRSYSLIGRFCSIFRDVNKNAIRKIPSIDIQVTKPPVIGADTMHVGVFGQRMIVTEGRTEFV